MQRSPWSRDSADDGGAYGYGRENELRGNGSEGRGSASIVAVSSLAPCFRHLFDFRYFNSLQNEIFDIAFNTPSNLAISAPTGSGKTVIFELALLHMLRSCVDAHGNFIRQPGRRKAVYVAPMRAICSERMRDWSRRFGSGLGLSLMELTGDSREVDFASLHDVDLILTTPEKFDSITRRNIDKGGMAFFADIALFAIDEVHVLNEDRGAALEAVVSRLKMLSQRPDLRSTPIASIRFVACSATIPNYADVGEWLGAPPSACRAFGDEFRAVTLQMHVHGYNEFNNDFLFERNLKNYIGEILAAYRAGKPALVFCSSRKGAQESAECVARGAGGAPPGHRSHPFVPDARWAQLLAQEAAAAEHAKLRELVRLRRV